MSVVSSSTTVCRKPSLVQTQFIRTLVGVARGMLQSWVALHPSTHCAHLKTFKQVK